MSQCVFFRPLADQRDAASASSGPRFATFRATRSRTSGLQKHCGPVVGWRIDRTRLCHVQLVALEKLSSGARRVVGALTAATDAAARAPRGPRRVVLGTRERGPLSIWPHAAEGAVISRRSPWQGAESSRPPRVLTSNLRTDVSVIGATMAGLSCALELNARGGSVIVRAMAHASIAMGKL